MSQASRYQRSTPALVGAMIVTVVFVLLFVAWRALFRAEGDAVVVPVEWERSVELAEGAGLRIVRPDELPDGWTATSVDLAAGDDPRWGLGVLTDEGAFIGIRQEDTSVEELVRTYVDKEAEPGDPVTFDSPVASEWDTWTDDGGDRGYSTDLGDDAVLVYGSAGVEDLEVFLESLRVTNQ